MACSLSHVVQIKDNNYTLLPLVLVIFTDFFTNKHEVKWTDGSLTKPKITDCMLCSSNTFFDFDWTQINRLSVFMCSLKLYTPSYSLSYSIHTSPRPALCKDEKKQICHWLYVFSFHALGPVSTFFIIQSMFISAVTAQVLQPLTYSGLFTYQNGHDKWFLSFTLVLYIAQCGLICVILRLRVWTTRKIKCQWAAVK